MELENLRPASGHHSVKSFAMALDWQGELSPQTLTGIQNLAKKLKDYFPTVEVQKHLMIKVQPNGPTQNTDAIGGVSYQRLNSYGTVSSQLTVSRQNCVLVVNDYTRWEETLGMALRYFEIVLPTILADKSLSAVSLQYMDAFNWKDDPSSFRLRDVLREDCEFLARNIFAAPSFWHSHHGFMLQATAPVKHTLLNNINANLTDEGGDLSVQVLSVHKATLEKVIRLNTENYIDLIRQLQDSLHAEHKKIFKQVFTSQVCDKVGMS